MTISVMNRSPINKMASVILSQCGCEDEYKLNGLMQQRDMLKATATKLMAESSKSNFAKARNRPIIKEVNKNILALNARLRPYDEHHRRQSPKTYEQAFRNEVVRVYGREAFERIDAEARRISGFEK